ncbi:MAG: hypothetical protein A2V66_09125 [Ignavibacteria bacterium RBG_13_36_8]|nr:MAG: hypothetical protein A2V66_09125 [Ignavibacteria bacterium RBG_13_36_8]
MEKYIKAIQDRICSICVDSSDEGNCTLNEKELCAVQYFLPQILEVVHSKQTDKVEEYYPLLKEKVCKECRTQDKNGNCYLREDANCSLDRYFSVIVETIQKVDAGKIRY